MELFIYCMLTKLGKLNDSSNKYKTYIYVQNMYTYLYAFINLYMVL